jgi:GAF domain
MDPAELHQPEAILDRLLGSFGQQHEVDRCYVFEFDLKRREMTNTSEWCAPGVASFIDHLQQVSFDTLPFFSKEMMEGRIVQIGSMEELDKLGMTDQGEKAEFIRENIQSMLLVPVFALNTQKVIGMVGFDSSVPREWKSEDVFVLETAIEVLMGMKLSALAMTSPHVRRVKEGEKTKWTMDQMTKMADQIVEAFDQDLRLKSGKIDKFPSLFCPSLFCPSLFCPFLPLSLPPSLSVPLFHPHSPFFEKMGRNRKDPVWGEIDTLDDDRKPSLLCPSCFSL